MTKDGAKDVTLYYFIYIAWYIYIYIGLKFIVPYVESMDWQD